MTNRDVFGRCRADPEERDAQGGSRLEEDVLMLRAIEKAMLARVACLSWTRTDSRKPGSFTFQPLE